MIRLRRRALTLALLTLSAVGGSCRPAQGKPVEGIRLPEGFRIALYAEGVKNARQMALGAKGTLFVGSLRAGRVHALVDRDRDGDADEVLAIASGLDGPSGVAFRQGSLYVAEVSRILRYDDIESRLGDPPRPVTVTDTLPKEHHHGWKFIAFGPDGLLYVPVGAPCNVCDPGDHPYGRLFRMKPDGSDREVFALGIRNSEGFDWHPTTKELWFTDNGRDWLGDDLPPDELNRAPRAGLHFGFPFCHGTDIADPEFGAKRPCKEFVPVAAELGPHVAALGMEFYRGTMFPKEYRNRIFIAEHGSWNRTEPIGYRVTTVTVDGERARDYQVFAEGWLRGGRGWGRPADVLVMPDGALLVSDDERGAIYRITWEGD